MKFIAIVVFCFVGHSVAAKAANKTEPPLAISASRASLNNPSDVQVKCNEYNSGTQCYLSFYGNKTYSRFTPVATNGSLVTYVSLGGRIPVLAEDICNAFPNVETLSLTYCQIEEILEGAFDKCRNVKNIYLSNNYLRVIPRDVFRYNQQLTYLNMYNCRLKELKTGLFAGLYNLRELSLYDNYLTEFPAELLKTNSELRTLNLFKNDLLDLDEEKLSEYLPNLSNIYLNNNQFSCDRLQQIRNFMSQNVYVTDSIYTTLRKRSYLHDTLQGYSFLCLPVDTWLSVYNQVKASKKKDASYQISISGN